MSLGTQTPATRSRKIRVLIVDDSPTVRRIVRRFLEAEPDMEVVGEAADAFVARDMVLQLAPDVLTLDIVLPRVDGISFLRVLMRERPMPVVVLSSLTTEGSELAMEAVALGAVEVLTKADETYLPQHMQADLVRAVRAAAGARVTPTRSAVGMVGSPSPRPTRAVGDRLIAVGASTGGPGAIESILGKLAHVNPTLVPPIVIVQHMPPTFIGALARRLDSLTALSVREAQHGHHAEAGEVLIAPGGQHMTVRKDARGYCVALSSPKGLEAHCPSVDVLFESVARVVGREATGVLLTGMGSDGAAGLLAIRKAGGTTIAQDEATCVVYGMPRVALELGAIRTTVPLDRIATRMLG